jgi:Sedlin, N-terminal conserved region
MRASAFEEQATQSTRMAATHTPAPDAQQQTQYLHQFVLHASLDAVDEAMWASKEPYLKVLHAAALHVGMTGEGGAQRSQHACATACVHLN